MRAFAVLEATARGLESHLPHTAYDIRQAAQILRGSLPGG